VRALDLTRSIRRWWWTLRRFGLSPDKLGPRLTNRAEPKVLCVSVPKAGTHLLERALCLHPRLYRKLVGTVRTRHLRKWGSVGPVLDRLRPGQVLMTHLHHTPELEEALRARDIRTVFLVRDPRDVVVSEANYLARRRDHRLHDLFAAQVTPKDKLLLVIRGDPAQGAVSIGRKLERYSGWLDSGAAVVRFEDLIGAAGGGEDSRQLGALRAIYGHLGLAADEATLRAIQAELHSEESPTFHKGAIGAWRKAFDQEVAEAFRAETDGLPARYGYPGL